MNKIFKSLPFLIIFACIATFSAQAQISTPAPSPSAKLEQRVGLTDVTIDYSRPGVKGRQIFGGLIPYDQIWRTGANASTKITFSDDVVLGGKEIPKGTYALYTKPSKTSWTVMVYKDLTLGGNVSKYQESKELTKFSVEVTKMPFKVESMTFMVNDISDDKANIYLIWDDVSVSMPLKVEVDSKVMGEIETAMAGPSANEYYAAAQYYYNTDRDMKQALKWMDSAMETMGDRFWVVTLRARILGKMKDYKNAIATSEKAIGLAKSANNNDYVKINEDLIAGWKKM